MIAITPVAALRGLLLTLLLALAGCQPTPPAQTRIQGKTMGTYYVVTLSDNYPVGSPPSKAT